MQYPSLQDHEVLLSYRAAVPAPSRSKFQKCDNHGVPQLRTSLGLSPLPPSSCAQSLSPQSAGRPEKKKLVTLASIAYHSGSRLPRESA